MKIPCLATAGRIDGRTGIQDVHTDMRFFANYTYTNMGYV